MRLAVAIGVLLGIGGTAALVGWPREAAARRTHDAAAAEGLREERRVVDADIALYEAAARVDTMSATFPARAAALYLQRARSTGSDEDIRRAESSARRSMAMRTGRNGDASVALIGALVAQHRFAEARDIAAALVAGEPDVPAYRAMLGETALELGRYDEARTVFLSLDSVRARPEVAIRYVRFMELTGRAAEGRALLQRIGPQFVERDDVPRRDVAWYWLRLGDLELREGRARRARRAYEAGLAAAPDDHRLLLALARLDAAQGRLADARARAESAFAAVYDPATMVVLAEIAIAQRDSVRLTQYRRALEATVSGSETAPHRAWSLALLDQDRHVEGILARAEHDLRARRDVFGHDLLAWALYKRGEHRRAARVIDTALAQGTQDGLLHFHAGMIQLANRDSAGAARHLRHALRLNPFFGITHPAVARAVLDTLDARMDDHE